MTDCHPDPTERFCIHCGWKKPERIVGWPRRNCSQQPSRGLGDTVAKFTTALGISPCSGCKQRQAWLNEKFPYAKSPDAGTG
jgi:hypothetical protein